MKNLELAKTYITEIDGKWYAFEGDTNNDRVYSIGSDNPPRESCGSRWFARWTNEGIKYVSTSSPSRSAAYKKAARHGTYSGEV